MFLADIGLAEKIGLLVPLQAIQACWDIEKKSGNPPKDFKSEIECFNFVCFANSLTF